ncbi:glycoside hydrolase family 5 protein [Aureimonas sp. AU12]|uniref:glycoside hydrolase family 5 protein n=1 Tax=Aureimonas sp. AU12 TaxID=1638161 RepID=UPI000A967102|nr:cellulase family glycosylhydrolase [Aureimonas sp. AU12]
MFRPVRHARALSLACAIGVVAPAQAVERCAAPPGFANPAALVAMAQGFNLPGWDRDGRPGEARLRTLRKLHVRGMTHVRLPIDDAQLRAGGGAAADADAYLADLDAWIVALHGLGFAVSVDLHPGSGLGTLFRERPAAALAETKAIWAQLAPVLAQFDPATTYAELLNEPPVDPSVWRTQLPELAAVVRSLLPKHTLVVAPFGPQRHESLADVPLLDDPNAIYAVHYYDPFAFTHQGADWTGPDSVLPKLVGLPWPSPAGDRTMTDVLDDLAKRGEDAARKVVADSLLDGWTEADVARAYATMADWSDRTGRPVVVNEFGVYAGAAPRQARLAWLTTAAKAARSRCIGWTHWDYEDGFGILDASGRIDAAVLDALLPNALETRP